MTATRWTGMLVPAVLALSLSAALQAQTAPPAGAVLKQNAPPPGLPAAPGAVLSLPAPSQQDADAATPIPVRRIDLQGNTLVPTRDLEPLVKGLEGRTVTLGALRQAARRITAMYQSRGYPLAHAFVPAQRIPDGVVRIAIVEPRYDRIAIDDHSRLSTQQARRTLGLTSGQAIASDNLNRGLLLLNRTPGVRVAGTLVPGAQPDTSSLEVGLTDTPLVHVQLHADNYGNTYTGRIRSGADLSLDNPLGHGSQVALTTLTTSGGLLHAGGFNVISPDLSHGLRAGLYGSRTLYRLGGTFASLGLNGHVNQIGADLDYPLILRPGRLLQARLDLLRDGFDQKNRAVATLSHSHLRMARLSLSGARADSQGSTSGGLSISRGALSLDNADARLADAASLRAGGTFWIAQLQARRDQNLANRWMLRMSLDAQLASHPLDGSQKFYLGGPYGVMSAPVNDAGGDAGVLLDLRLSHPLLDVGSHHLTGAFLLQTGKTWHRSTAASDALSMRLSGAGLGLDYRWQQTVHASLAYLHGLGTTRTPDGPRADGEVWARLTVDL